MGKQEKYSKLPDKGRDPRTWSDVASKEEKKKEKGDGKLHMYATELSMKLLRKFYYRASHTSMEIGLLLTALAERKAQLDKYKSLARTWHKDRPVNSIITIDSSDYDQVIHDLTQTKVDEDTEKTMAGIEILTGITGDFHSGLFTEEKLEPYESLSKEEQLYLCDECGEKEYTMDNMTNTDFFEDADDCSSSEEEEEEEPLKQPIE